MEIVINGRRARYIAGGIALVAVSCVGLGSMASTALFTDTKSTNAAAITTGNVTLTPGGTADTTLAATALMPGDTKYGSISVTGGSAASRVAATADWSPANAMTNDMQLTMVTVPTSGSTCTASNFSLTISNVALTSNVATITTSAAHGLITGTSVTISGLSQTALNGTYTVASTPTTTTFTFAKTNANITSVASAGTAVPAVMTWTANTTSLKLYGDSATGNQTGDRAFAASASEYYCVRLALPLASTASSLSSSLTFTFNAEQTANN